jgi:PTH1 family peptidyl-tRNA hydrolase
MAEPVYLVVGLGNPGPEYELTPHNLGFLAIDRIAQRTQSRISRFECQALIGTAQLSGQPALLVKPQTFMNLSGQAVKGLCEKYSIAPGKVIVVYDELDLPWTSVRIKPNGSAAGHRGIKDLIRCLGTDEFIRVRLGIHLGTEIRDGAKFVLAQFKSAQRQELDSLLDRAADAVESIIAEGVEKAMTAHNRRAPGTAKEEE